MDAKRFPIDYEALNKGDVIAVAEVERLVQCPRDHRLFAMKATNLASTISLAMDDLGRPVTIVLREGDLRVLTDDEASQYNHEMFKQFFRRMGRSLRRLAAVDVGQLDSEERGEHLRRLEVNGKTFAAAMKTRQREWGLVNHQRSTPRLQAQPSCELETTSPPAE